MSELAQQKCTPCKGGEPPLTEAEIARLQSDVPEWELVERKGVPQLKRVFRFKNFTEALTFTNEVGRIAEEADHHPTIITAWGRVTVRWWTHAVGGLHLNDFIMASRTDALYRGAEF